MRDGDCSHEKNEPRSGAHSHPRRCYPATCLMRAIISSTAFSGAHLSTTTRFTALAHTFSLLRTVNFQFLVNSKGTVPAENCACTILRCGASVQNERSAPAFFTGYQRPSAPSTYGVRFSSCIANCTNSFARFL